MLAAYSLVTTMFLVMDVKVGYKIESQILGGDEVTLRRKVMAATQGEGELATKPYE